MIPLKIIGIIFKCLHNAISVFQKSCVCSGRFPCKKQQMVLCPRWSSPKLMASRILTKESDIWALSVTFWELFSNGSLPYENMKGEMVKRTSSTEAYYGIKFLFLRMDFFSDFSDEKYQFREVWVKTALILRCE